MSEFWDYTTLGEISEVITKGTTPTSVGFKFIDKGVNFVKVESLTKDGTFIESKFAHIDDACNDALKRSQLRTSDILFSIAGALGRTAIVTSEILPANTNQALAIIRLKSSVEILPEFVERALSSGMLLEQIEKQRGGVAQQNLSLTQVKSFTIPLPSIPEQKRIVAILDEAFVGISQAVTNAEKNLANARELFESYLYAAFTQDGEGWESVKLNEISTKITDGVHKKPHYVDNGVPFIKINNLTAGLGISFDGVSYISKEDHELFCKRTNPEKGDILITKDGTIGIVRIIDTDVEFSIFVSVALIKPIDKSISPYLKYVLESPLIQNQINPQGAALKHLYLRDLREFLVPLPPKEVQDRIVEQLDSFSVEFYRLKSIYQQKLNSLNELKQSLLQKAFTGELTTETALKVANG